ncbi:hypothetical protein P691DRAFT_762748 [Macrolepiota fuliginosa MF-IS2]|uniref:Uncharacterized protein n=1 Tax=Macrolepiota fuliginosa MF-IS2 TaxID=1400762 RepID=A0A9P5X9C1_9AGAR|nr:hypothetical protein P691DRAFT_762748 [Macrolepiota fuliginosa MF-IS2]
MGPGGEWEDGRLGAINGAEFASDGAEFASDGAEFAISTIIGAEFFISNIIGAEFATSGIIGAELIVSGVIGANLIPRLASAKSCYQPSSSKTCLRLSLSPLIVWILYALMGLACTVLNPLAPVLSDSVLPLLVQSGARCSSH